MTNEDERLISRKRLIPRESHVVRLTPVRTRHPPCPGLAGPLPRPDHPQGTLNGWSGRGSGPARPSWSRRRSAHQY